MISSYYDAVTAVEESARMRGPDEQTNHLFSYIGPEQRVRPDHPLRAIRRMTDEVFTTLSPRFEALYSDIGRPSIPPEQLLRALLLQYLCTVRSERFLMKEIDCSIRKLPPLWPPSQAISEAGVLANRAQSFQETGATFVGTIAGSHIRTDGLPLLHSRNAPASSALASGQEFMVGIEAVER